MLMQTSEKINTIKNSKVFLLAMKVDKSIQDIDDDVTMCQEIPECEK